MKSIQKGNTLLGLIIGALVGLGIALGVAVYITKMPVPFMNKGQTTSKPETDAAEAKKNKDWNPNAPLAGKNPAKTPPSNAGDVSIGTVTEAPATAEPDNSTAPPERTPSPDRTATERTPPERTVRTPRNVPDNSTAAVTPPPKAARPTQSADPLGDLAKSKLDAGANNDPFNYFIQAGAYRTPEDAEQQRAKLLLLGMQAKVSERDQAGRTVYRVRVGPFSNKDDADKIKNRLDNNSIETALVRVQR